MRALYRRSLRDDRGSIILALLGIVILTTVASVGLSAVVTGQHQSRHDNTFTQALNNAESGIDAMVATIKNGTWTAGSNTYLLNSPSQVLSIPTSDLPKLSGTVTQAGAPAGTYSVSASPRNDIGVDGSAKYTTWTITSTGTAVTQSNTITRTVSEVVRVQHSYNTPVEGAKAITMGPGASLNIGNYQYVSPAGQNGSTGPAPNTTDTASVAGVGLSILGIPITLATVTLNNLPTNTSPGAAQTGGPLTLTDPSGGIDSIALDQGGSCTPTVAGSTACSGSTVVSQTNIPAPPIAPIGCASTDLTGATATVAGLGTVDLTVLPLSGPLTGGLVLNDNVGINLAQSPPVTNDICTTLPVIIPTVGINLDTATLPDGLGSVTSTLASVNATLQVPVGANCAGVTSLVTGVLSGNVQCNMSPPNDLVINQLGTAPVVLGTSTSSPTYISATITNANGDCYIAGNVTLIGSLQCKTITIAAGASLTVDYPYTIDGNANNVGASDTENQDAVSSWNESHAD